jgi:hypothetical protein
MPGTIDQELGDIRRQLLALNTAGATPQLIPYSESVDAGHAMDLDFPLSSGVQPAFAKLSFKFKPYRTTSSFAGGNTGGQSVSHSHPSAAHGHETFHALGTQAAVPAMADLMTDGNANGYALLFSAGVDAVSFSTTPGSTGAGSVDHAHPVGGSSLGVTEGTSTTITAIGVDGVDKTSLLGGPWTVDTVDLDVSKVLPLGDGAWHRITLTSAGQGRIVAVLRM